MTLYVAAADGAWSAGLNIVTNTPTLHASTNITLNSAVGIFTQAFTAPNLVNACVGVLFHVTTKPVTATYTVTLQESGIDTAATVSIADTDFPPIGNWIFFKFPVPYVFTTIVAGSYRFKITRAAAATNTQVAADSGGANPAFLAVDDRTGVPGLTDDIWIVGANGSGTVSVTMDGTQTLGSGTNTTGLSQRTIGNAVTICKGGLLTWDTAASATLTSKGNVTVSGGGELRMGTVATYYPTGRVASLIFNENGTTTQYGLETYIGGKLTLQGEPKTSTSLWKTTYTSGVGTAADPFIVADAVDWAVGDEILVCAYSANATNYQETENKFIITKNSTTSYVLADTAGGGESALTYTHTAGAYVLNVQRNVIIKSSTTTEGMYYYNANTTAGDVNIDWVRFETMGSSTTGKNGLLLVASSTSTLACDYSVAYRPLYKGYYWAGLTQLSFTGLISCKQNSPSAVGGFDIASSGGSNKTLTDCFSASNNRVGFYFTATNISLARCIAISNNLAGSGTTVTTGGFALSLASKITMLDCEAHCNRTMGMTLSNTTLLTANNLLLGSKGTNAIDINLISSSVNDATFINSYTSSATNVNGYAATSSGTSLRFQYLNGTTNNHIWYTNTGIARSTGAALVDTTTRTVGALAVRLAPEDSTTGLFWEFQILARANSAVSISGFIQKNVAFGTDVCTVELFLPGSTAADATQTMGNTTGSWLVFSLAASYTASVPGLATVRITAKSTTAAAYVYVADLFNGTNAITNLTTWYNGQPASIIYPELGDPAAVWAELTATMTTVGSIGKLLVDDIDTTISSRATAASIAALNNLSAAQVNAEVVDALTVDTYAEPVAVPAATSSFKDKLNWLFALARNKILQTATQQTLRNDADAADIGTAQVSDNGVTATRDEWV